MIPKVLHVLKYINRFGIVMNLFWGFMHKL